MLRRHLLAAGASLPFLLSLSPVQKTSRADSNEKAPLLPLSPLQLRELIEQEEALAGVQPMATALFPGPLNSFSISLALANEAGAEITEMTFDPFGGLGGQGLVIESVFGLGILLAYPAFGGGRGPVVSSFASFAPGDMIAMGMDPDSYTNTSFGALVQDMVGSRIELAFADGSRGAGILRATDLGNVAAFVTQVFP